MSPDPLLPHARAMLREDARRHPVPTDRLPLETARAQAVDAAWKQRDPIPVGRVRDTFIPSPGGDVPVRYHYPPYSVPTVCSPQVAAAEAAAAHGETEPTWADRTGDAALPALLLLPGGGWVTGSADLADVMAREIAANSGCVVVTATYRKAPENPFPAPLVDCLAVFCHLVEHAADLGLDPDRIGVIGDSAGGNLAAAVCLAIRDAAELPIPAPPTGTHAARTWRPEPASAPACQILIYPAADAACDTGSYADFGEGCGLTAERMAFYWDCYAPGELRDHPLASVLRADLGGLPPALVITAGVDVLRDEGIALSAGFSAAGTESEHWDVPGIPHGFVHACGALPEAARTVERIAGWVRSRLVDEAAEVPVSA